MSHWNHRVVRCDGELRIFDVYYDDLGRPVARSVTPTWLSGESLDELYAQLQLIEEALGRPILNDSEIGRAAPTLAPHD
ncbi:hypothetical protein [Chitinolyticbacter albus]|uniref:hypothetical protein n=1 Tax=Chitinolyticbacter albus TaxID=2961951 RepID=UPI0021094C10|nr:hypothetical protein [Chitinolyticbacter albus]